MPSLQMPIDPRGGVGGCVPYPLGDDGQGDATGDHAGYAGVPEVVEAVPLQPRLLEPFPPGPLHVGDVVRSAGRGAEHVVARSGLRSQEFHRLSRQQDRPVGRAALQLPREREAFPFKVHRLPSQVKRFGDPAAHEQRERRRPEGDGTLQGFEDLHDVPRRDQLARSPFTLNGGRGSDRATVNQAIPFRFGENA